MRKNPSHAQTWQHFDKRRIQVMVHLCLCHDNASGSKEVFRNIKRRVLSLSFQSQKKWKLMRKRVRIKKLNAMLLLYPFLYREREIYKGVLREGQQGNSDKAQQENMVILG